VATLDWYKLIWWDNTVEFPYVSNLDDLKGFDDWHLTCGETISNWNDQAWIQCTNPEYDGNPDDVLANHLGVPIYSSRLRQALEWGGIAGIQYLPIHVLHRDGSEIPGYRVANFLNKVKALDLERSQYTLNPDDYFIPERRGQIFTLDEVVLKRDPLAGLDIIRLEEYFTFEAASERFKEAFEAARCTGYSFRKLAISAAQ